MFTSNMWGICVFEDTEIQYWYRGVHVEVIMVDRSFDCIKVSLLKEQFAVLMKIYFSHDGWTDCETGPDQKLLEEVYNILESAWMSKYPLKSMPFM